MTQKLKVVYRKLADLKPYENNARTHSDAQLTQIAASIKEFGFTQPILLDGENGIIAGHGRWQAAIKMGIHEVPTIDLSHLNEEQKRAYIIADNKLALNADWDESLLALEIGDLQSIGYDIDLLGFSKFELETLGQENDDGEKVDSDQPTEVNFTIQFNIVFDHEEQQNDWYSFVKHLKGEFPEAETLGERLQLFIRDGGYGTNQEIR
jgi:ParB-like chromosome segregation protein Spo0J